VTTEQHLGNHHVYGDKAAAIYATADGNLRVALVGGGREIQSWPIARTTEAIREIGGRLRAIREALVSKHGPDTAGAPRATATQGPKLDDAGLATPKRVKPADSWKGDADAVKALQSVVCLSGLDLTPARAGSARTVRATLRAGVSPSLTQCVAAQSGSGRLGAEDRREALHDRVGNGHALHSGLRAWGADAHGSETLHDENRPPVGQALDRALAFSCRAEFKPRSAKAISPHATYRDVLPDLLLAARDGERER
jgi:hypothetical protein